MLPLRNVFRPRYLKPLLDPQDLKRRSVQAGVLIYEGQGARFVMRFCLCHRGRTAADSGGFWHGSDGIPILGFLSTFNDLGFGQAIVQSAEITSGAIKLSTAASPTLISMLCQNRAEI